MPTITILETLCQSSLVRHSIAVRSLHFLGRVTGFRELLVGEADFHFRQYPGTSPACFGEAVCLWLRIWRVRIVPIFGGSPVGGEVASERCW